MTLNITLLADSTVFQSADHRLWDPRRGEVITDTSNKLVSLRTWALSGFVTYTGIGRWQDRDTSSFVVDWLGIQSSLTFAEAVENLRGSGSQWLRDIERSTGRRWAHTFIAATFTRGTPTVILLSNFEALDAAPLTSPVDELIVSRIETLRPRAIVTGCSTSAVSRRSRRALERLAAHHPNDPARIRHAITQMNLEAARAQPGVCPISEECTVHSVDRHGRGHGSGGPPGAPFRSLMDGVDVGAILEKVARDAYRGGRVRVVGTTSVTNQSRPESASSCARKRTAREVDPRYVLIDLEPNDEVSGVARASAGSLIVGERSQVPIGPSQPYAWTASGHGQSLPTLGGLTGQALGINAAGSVVGAIEMPGTRASRAVMWPDLTELTLLPTDGATHSGASVVLDSGDIGGWVSYHLSEVGQQHFRPAVWLRGREFRCLEDFGAEWGQTRDIAPDGWILVSAHIGMRIFPVLWDGADVVSHLIGPDQSVIPVSIFEGPRVLGWTRDREGRSVAIVWSEADGWRPLGIDPDWYVSCSRANGQVAGHWALDGFARPWVMEPRQAPRLLPHYEYHHTRLASINGSGVIAGSAQSDHGAHPLVWKLVQD